MDFLKEKAGSLGSLMAIVGIISSVLSFFNYNLRILMWVDLWGTTVGWIIRIALIVVGAALFFMFGASSEESEEQQELDEAK